MEYYIEFEKLNIHSMMILVVKSIVHLIQSHESTIFSGDCAYDYDLRWTRSHKTEFPSELMFLLDYIPEDIKIEGLDQ